MKLGIIGKPQAGKTTIFNAASGQQEAVGDFSQAAHRAIIKVPDPRLAVLAEIEDPKKITPAEIEFLDAPGFTGKGKEAGAVEISQEVRLMEALILVVDAFSPDAAPERDLRNLTEEMILSDLSIVEGNLDKKGRKMKLTGDKSATHDLELLETCRAQLEGEQPLIDLDMAEEDLKALRGYSFLTLKPLLIAVNIAEDALDRAGAMREGYAGLAAPGKRDVAVVCGRIEAELAALPEIERAAFLADLGIATPAVDQVIRKSYDLLGLISFLTAAKPEVRAWTIRAGTTAQRAAGVIHSDIERGFIRAEVTRFEDYARYRTPAALKAAGKTRLEGKDYVVQDGDVILFRFNV
ncbi:MAG TPA: DUF933 domain-containing protein [candidate division Zixibacteria bacterium]|nr:YchF family ATPase [candidate division Zixibacteria bacterium]MDD4918253.1 DUF933 domain-containing protein [candidate division Zixibacteria bacterium]MDM7973994.1 DUF933 domain-containing protein [candidate division Zixibacteria bacterium]HOD66515.1 DUF933 domain-containing protein [candidate division Zixibacteria bacterium]HPC10873.1 DUF933 domain-containing protein [candidate division Zixibacteria bacterium]